MSLKNWAIEDKLDNAKKVLNFLGLVNIIALIMTMINSNLDYYAIALNALFAIVYFRSAYFVHKYPLPAVIILFISLLLYFFDFVYTIFITQMFSILGFILKSFVLGITAGGFYYALTGKLAKDADQKNEDLTDILDNNLNS